MNSPFGLPSQSKGKSNVSNPSKRTERLAKGRSSHTNQNKLRRLKAFYKGTFKRSQELKQSEKYSKRTKFFCDKFPTEESYLSKYPLRQVLAKK